MAPNRSSSDPLVHQQGRLQDSPIGRAGPSPYAALGLRRNPFITLDEAGVAAELWLDRGWSEAPAPRDRKLVQVMGVRGAGKTSHLKHWQAQTGGPYCHYPPGWRRFKLPKVGAIAYWDEANRIPWPVLAAAFAWAALTRATIVAGTHADLGRLARCLGLRAATIQLPPLDTETLLAWATRRIEAARLPNTACHLSLSSAQAASIVATADGSWRNAANQLHIWAAAACQPAEIA